MIEGVSVNPTLPRPSEKASGRAVYALPAGAKEEVLLAYSLGIVPLSLAATSGRVYSLETSGPRTFAAP